MRSGWLLRDGDVVCALEMAESTGERNRGLLGRDACEGGLHLPGRRSVHTFGMRFTIDLALLSADLTVLHLLRVPPNRVVRPRRRVDSLVEAQSGAWERWGLQVGDQLDIRQVEEP
jgi:hypothetical protein